MESIDRFKLGAACRPALVILLLLFTGALRFPDNQNELFNAGRFLLIFLIYEGMLVAWALSIRRRMLHSHIRGYLLGIAGLMLFWVLIRSLKHGPFGSIDPVARFLWYCFYIPMALIPLLSFFAALCLGKPESWRPSRRYSLLFIPAALLIFGILTNDSHQLAFGFAPGDPNWSSNYTYQIIYYLTAIWMGGLFLAAVGLFFQKSYIRHTKKRLWLPLGLMGLIVVYALLYAVDNSKSGVGFIEMTAMYCAVAVGIWESCIYTGLLPSNTKHGMFFDLSPLGAQILDAGGTVRYCSKRSLPVSADLLERLKSEGTAQPEADVVLHLAPIRGGSVVWREDISRLARLIEALREIEAETQDEVELLQTELDAKARRLHLEEQSRLYSLTLHSLTSQIQSIKENLDAIPGAEEAKKRRLLWETTVLGTYIKRRSNLVLMAEGGEAVTAEELARCIKESMESLEAGGISCALLARASGALPPDYALLCYDLFEAAAEAALGGLQALFVTISDREQTLRLTVELETESEPEGFPAADWQREALALLDGRILRECEAGRYYIALHLPKGGERR